MHAALLVVLAVAPVLGPEVDPNDPPEAVSQPLADAQLVSSGSHLLVVWTEVAYGRSGIVRVSAVDPATGVLDAHGVPILPSRASYGTLLPATPRVSAACDASGCVAAWLSWIGEVVAVRFAADGTPTDAAPTVVSAGPATGVAASRGGGVSLVAWSEPAAGGVLVRARRMAADGSFVDAVPVELGRAEGGQALASAASDTGHLVAFASTLGLRAVLVPTDGSPPGAEQALAIYTTVTPRVASDGTAFLVGWQGDATEVQHVGADGVPSPSPSFVGDAGRGLALAGDADGFVAVFDAAGRAVVRRIAADGAVVDAADDLGALFIPWQVRNDAPLSVASHDGTRFVAALHDALAGPLVHVLGPTGSPSAAHDVSLRTAPGTLDVELEPTGDGFVVAFDELRPSGVDVRTRFLDADGHPLAPASLVVTDVGWPWNEGEDLHLAAMPDLALVAWDERTAQSTSMRVRPVGPDGALAGPDYVLDGSARIALASDGTAFLAAGWAAHVPSVRLSATGEVLDDPPLAVGGDGIFEPAATFGGGVYLVAGYSHEEPRSILAFRVDPAGLVLDPVGIPLATGRNPATVPPEISFDGTSFLVVWNEWNHPDAVVGVRVGLDGSVLDPEPLTIAGGPYVEVQGVAFDGRTHLVLVGEQDGALRGVRIDAAGGLVDTQPFEIVRERGWESDVAALGPGSFLLAYTRNVDEAPYAAVRPRLRTVTALEAGAACDHDADCLSGTCADGVCCDAACDGACDACSVAAGAAADGACTVVGDARVCRGAVGVCDVEERCDGVQAACPADALAGEESVCRGSAAPCDAEERCDGASVDCGPDRLAGAETVCREAAGGCDVEERCDGASLACPDDRLRARREVCREAAGPCDLTERCDGETAACPDDALQAEGWACRPTEGVCDPEERCDGATVACPGDVRAIDAVCRTSTGPCDPEERCDGVAADCGADLELPDGGSCEDGDPATTGETCDARGVCGGGTAAAAAGAGGGGAPAGGGGGCGAASPGALAPWALALLLSRRRRRR